MSVFCTRCGSTSHTAFDCSAPDQRLAPPATEPSELSAVKEPAEDEAVGLEEDKDGRVLSERPRHPAWPLTCEATGLLAFDGEGDAKAFAAKWCPSCHVEGVEECGACGRWHLSAQYPHPSADKPRDSVYPRNPFKPFRRAAMRPSAFEHVEPELPRQPDRPASPKPEPPTAPRKPRARPGRQAALF